MPYIKLLQDVLQELPHIGLNLFVPVCCNTANFDAILLRTIDHCFETIQFHLLLVTSYLNVRDVEV